MVDSYVTPQAIAADVSADKAKERSQKSNKAKGSDENPIASWVRWKKIKYAFFSGSPFSFRIDITPDEAQAEAPIELRFQWSGNWKLTRVTLPSDALDRMPSIQDNRATSPKVRDVDQLPTLLDVTLISKKFREGNVRSGDFGDKIVIELLIKNLTDKDIRAFDGTLTLADVLDNEIISSKVAIDDPLKSKSSLTWNGAISYNQFMDTHIRLRNSNQENLKASFIVRKVVFKDGSTTEF